MITDGKIIVTTGYTKDWYHCGRIAAYGAWGESYVLLHDDRSQTKRMTTQEAMTDAELLALDYAEKNKSVKFKMVKDKTRIKGE